MSIDVNLRDISAGFGSPTLHNANNASIEAAFTKALDRTSNAGDNAMEVDLDMALNQIFNVEEATENHMAVPLGQLQKIIAEASSGLIAVLSEEQIATKGQTIFNLVSVSYAPNINNIAVYINGVRQSHGSYTETDSTTITFSEGLTAGDKVVFLVNEAISTVDGREQVYVADTVAAMKVASVSAGTLVQTEGYHTAGDGGGAEYLIKTAAEYGGTPDGYGDHLLANGHVAVVQVGKSVVLTQYGMHPTMTSTQNKAALEAAYAAHNSLTLPDIAGGIYNLDDGVNLGQRNDFELIFEGKAELHNVGVGTTLTFDGSGSTVTYGIRLINPRLTGNANTQTGLLVRACSHIYIERPVIRDVAATAMLFQWVIEGTILQPNVSSNEGAFSVVPVNGIVLEEYTTGLYCAGCNFIGVTLEGLSGYGIEIRDNCQTNNFTGTSEGNGGGLYLKDQASDNNFTGLYCEANSEADARIQEDCDGNIFNNFIAKSTGTLNNLELEGGSNNTFNGGFIRSIMSRVDNRRNIFNGVAVPDGSLGFQETVPGADAKNLKVGCRRVDAGLFTVAQVTDQLGEFGTFLPDIKGLTTTGTFTVTSRAGFYNIVGNICHISIEIDLLTYTGTGVTIIDNLPFGCNNVLDFQLSLKYSNFDLAGGYTATAYIKGNSNDIYFNQQNDNVPASDVTHIAFQAGTKLWITGAYPISLG